MEKGLLLIAASAVAIHIPTLFIGIPRAIKLSKQCCEDEHNIWATAAQQGGTWIADPYNIGSQIFLSAELCHQKALACKRGLTVKEYSSIIFKAIRTAFLLQIIVLAGWFYIELLIGPTPTQQLP